MTKDPSCPNCGGRSFSPVDPDDYYECGICEAPDAEYIAWYRLRWPDTLKKWEASRAA